MVKLDDALLAAAAFQQVIAPLCSRIELVGSLRRKKADVNDIDFLVKTDKLRELSERYKTVMRQVYCNGNYTKSGIFQFNGTTWQVDIFVASDKTWDTLLLVKTGSEQHNIKLAAKANEKGWHLHASGLGLMNERGELMGRTEQEIMEALGFQYVPPEQREK